MLTFIFYNSSNCEAYVERHIAVKEFIGFEESTQIKIQKLKELALTEEEILSIGSKLMKVVRTMNISFAGIIIITCFNCLLQTTAQLYTSSTVLFTREVKALILLSVGSFSIACLMGCRLFWLTCSGQGLSASMKNCAYQLERFNLTEKKDDSKEIQLLKQDLRYYSESPLTPASAFSISSSTLFGAYGTILTYLIVLLQFKVSEQSIKPAEQNTTNVVALTMNSSRTEGLT